MPQLQRILDYMEYLSGALDAEVTFHMEQGLDAVFTEADYRRLFRYNVHRSPYCMLVKSDPERNRECLLCQKKVLHRLAEVDSFTGCCRFDVQEFVFAIRSHGHCLGFISVGSFRAPQERFPKAGMLWQKYEALPAALPERHLLETLCYPLSLMLARMIEERRDQSLAPLPQRVCSYLQRSHTHETLEDLCRIFHVSASALSHQFKQSTGSTIKGYMNHLKIEDAKMLLRNRDFSVTEAALACGYDSVSYFIQLFKEETGVTPKVWQTKNT